MQDVFAVVPETLEEMFTASDEVVDVEILSSVVRGVGDPSNPYVRTFYTAKALRSLKGSVKGQVVFTQAAGELEFPDHILRAADEPLNVGRRYVVFLRRNDRFGGRMLVGERSGAFKINGDRIEPQGFGKLAEPQRNPANAPLETSSTVLQCGHRAGAAEARAPLWRCRPVIN